MPEYVYSIILVVVIVVAVMIFTKKKKEEIWKGTLEKKKKNYSTEDSIDTFTLVFRTDEGRKKNVTVTDRNYFDSWEAGDLAEKKQGEYFPTKV